MTNVGLILGRGVVAAVLAGVRPVGAKQPPEGFPYAVQVILVVVTGAFLKFPGARRRVPSAGIALKLRDEILEFGVSPQS
jgi:hypothetical protein